MCPCRECSLEGVLEARDAIELVLQKLPSRARQEVTQLIAGLDEELYRRTLPDPYSCRLPSQGTGWWHFRLHD
jgi:hypothetical protein